MNRLKTKKSDNGLSLKVDSSFGCHLSFSGEWDPKLTVLGAISIIFVILYSFVPQSEHLKIDSLIEIDRTIPASTVK
jgi:hypothetical protein